jgi:cell division protease FtsH
MVSSKKRFIHFSLFLILMLSLFNSVNEVQRDEISYSQFLKLAREAKIDKAVVTERIIVNVLLPVLSSQKIKKNQANIL